MFGSLMNTSLSRYLTSYLIFSVTFYSIYCIRHIFRILTYSEHCLFRYVGIFKNMQHYYYIFTHVKALLRHIQACSGILLTLPDFDP